VDIERPERVGDLNWSEPQARDFVDMMAGLWIELLGRLETDLPVSRSEDSVSVRSAVALEVPSNPMKFEAIEEYLRDFVFGHSMYRASGVRGVCQWCGNCAGGRCGASRFRSQPECRRLASVSGRD
jgi:hypothetical protein